VTEGLTLHYAKSFDDVARHAFHIRVRGHVPARPPERRPGA
jgi:hypothetical protein